VWPQFRFAERRDVLAVQLVTSVTALTRAFR